MGDVSRRRTPPSAVFSISNDSRSVQLQIDLSNLDTEKISTAWYALQEPNTSGGGILKIKYDPNEPPQYATQF